MKKLNKERAELQAYKRLYQSYQHKGISFADYMSFVVQNCFYCGAEPESKNPFGTTWEQHKKWNKGNKGFCKETWEMCFIPYTGIDKLVACSSYENLNNLVPCCRQCNFMKGVLSWDAFLNKIKEIALHMELNK
jgi:hypothetical protein